MGESITPARWRELEPLLDRVLDCAPHERAAFLNRACPDAKTRQELEQMLAECERDAGVIETAAGIRFASLLQQPEERPLPELLANRYRIESRIGPGGMATVYLATDTQYEQRRVAVKVLSSEVTAAVTRDRFLREIETAATLHHPNIVGLYDSGESDGFLYYVMPFVEGHSLRRRLQMQRHLTIADALWITTQAAEALTYAHARRIVHRDIKPENILLQDRHVFVCDFGIAHAVAEAGGPRLTATGVVIGTPQYMSPEQATGDPLLDHRSDIYSLACVLYEMLAGQPPFTAATRQQTIAQHIAAEVPSLRIVRPSVPLALQDAIEVALSKVPVDRYPSSEAFSAAVSHAYLAHTERESRGRLYGRATRIIAQAAMAFGILSTSGDERNLVTPISPPAPAKIALRASLDSSRYVLLPVDQQRSSPLTLKAIEFLRQALGRWTDVAVDGISEGGVGSAKRPGDDTASIVGVAAAARAGRIVHVAVSEFGDSLDIEAVDRDAGTDRIVARPRFRIAANAHSLSSAISALADSILFSGILVSKRVTRGGGTRSRAARSAFLRGHLAVDQGNLSRAMELFDSATTVDQSYAQAFVWQAMVSSWNKDPPRRWTHLVDRALHGGAVLDPRDRTRATALSSLGNGDVPGACRRWSDLVRLDSTDYTALLALADCYLVDSGVVVDPSSASGYRFRVNYNDVLRLYERAFRLQPAVHHAYRSGSFAQLRRVFKTGSNSLLFGRAVGDTLHFLAYPYLRGDSIVFVPYTESRVADGQSVTRTPQVDNAIRRQRRRFHDLATAFRVTSPQSADALEAVAVSLDMLANPSAVDSLRLARSLSRDAADRLRMAALEVWMRVKYSLPSNVSGLRSAATLADSLLADHPSPWQPDAKLLASLAALRGRANLVADFATLADSRMVSPAIAQTGPRLVAFAAMGGPIDSLRALESFVAAEIDRSLEGRERSDAWYGWLLRAAVLAVPEYRFRAIGQLPNESSMSGRLYDAWRAGDRARVQQLLTNLQRVRRLSVGAPDLMVDGIYPEAAILASLGDKQGALAWLTPTLDSVSFTETETFTDFARAGTLLRLVSLRADLEASNGDRTAARQWAQALRALWSKPDPFLDSILRRAKELSR